MAASSRSLTTRTVDPDGLGPIRIHDVGHGPAVVLVHGAGSMLDDFVFSGIVDRLAARHRVIAFDRPGYGGSARLPLPFGAPEDQADRLHRLLEAIGVARAVMVGHSWGALVALAHATRHPKATRAVVLLSGYLYPERRIDAALASLPALPVVGELTCRHVLPALMRRAVLGIRARAFAPDPVPPDVACLPIDAACRPDHLAAQALDFRHLRAAASRLSAGYGRLDLPIHVLTGDSDGVVDPRRHSMRFADEVAHAGFTSIPGSGHMPHHADPDAVDDAVTAVHRAPRTTYWVSLSTHGSVDAHNTRRLSVMCVK